MKRYSGLVALLAMAGCLTPGPKNYEHASKSQEDYTRERYDCEVEAKKMAAMGALAVSLKMNAYDAQIDRCLREKYGWYAQAKK